MERLKLVADVFRPTSAAFLARLHGEEPSVVLDLGCGPGETTRLLFECFPGARTIGIDVSSECVRAARERQTASMSFLVDDVSTPPLSGAPADLIYARLLLAHLRDPTHVVSDWITQLRPGGLLALEEIERIVTEDPLFERYLVIATKVLRVRGTELYIGATLSRMRALPGATIETNMTSTLQPEIGDAATMFALNLKTLRHDDTIQAGHSQGELDEIAEALAARSRDGSRDPISWEMRQLTIRRTGSRSRQQET